MIFKKTVFIITALLLFSVHNLFAQKWLPGFFIDKRGAKETGFIRPGPGGNGPIPNEGYIEFKEFEKADPTVLSTSDLQCFVAGQDSFVVAHAPGNETWSKKEFDFVRVAVSGETNIYATRGADGRGSSGRRRGVSVSPAVGVGLGSGGYGSGVGGGVGIAIGGGGFGGGGSKKMSYYYGANTATMQHVTDKNFIDVMSDVMGDEPEVVDQIRAGKYHLDSMEKLIEYFKKVQFKNYRN
ncbi:hypothetical protein [Mucilaginibacter pallidiroseus]|uniref:hypothetical protein n=1 Tax=Mucilaginibacter pallidiroseus TaxID=2599295 RepID=UPI001648F58A|nr:hypothetical protein [Mucilaginibacter pallidiroseus]